MSKPKAINRNKLVAFVLPISRKSCLHASGQNGVQQFFYLQESRVRSTLGGVLKMQCAALGTGRSSLCRVEGRQSSSGQARNAWQVKGGSLAQ